MDFKEVINDISKLEGLRLSSIRPGAEITVEKVDYSQGKIYVQNSSGKVFKRPMSEFQSIWNSLVSETAVRVEEVLRGSGSSRNQPETIFANLPYIEWLKVNNKKHITLVGEHTHPFGTKKEMDEFAAARIKERLFASCDSNGLVTIVVTEDMCGTSSEISSLMGTKPLPLEAGGYLFSKAGKSVALFDAKKSCINKGTYGLVPVSRLKGHSKTIKICGNIYGIISNETVNVFFLVRN